MKSLWSDSVEFESREPLADNISTDVVVVGAGLAGILTAYYLQKAGKNTIILERARVLSGVTKNTTAKITSQHGIIYSRLIQELGNEKARMYAQANESAIKQYAELISENGTDCDFERKSAYVYTQSDLKAVEDEVKAASGLGIDAHFADDCPLPFKTLGAVGFRNQAQFNPLKFIKPIVDSLTIYENCNVTEIQDNTIIINGNRIKGKDVVIATHYPIINVPGYYFARMHQSRSYVIALSDARNVDGMYIADDGKYSFRNYKDFLLLGGCGHRTGANSIGGAYRTLGKDAAHLYPGSSVKYSWSAQDCMPADGVPYIGRYAASTPNMYVATGFQKWGMTSSMAAARVITDLIINGKSEYEELFTPQRFNVPASAKGMASEVTHAVSGLYKSFIQPPKDELDKIKEGCGGIIEFDGKKLGVYKTPEGKLYTIDTKCPHLGCQLEWNPDDLAWECPCHGSRFNYKGELENSPATQNAKT